MVKELILIVKIATICHYYIKHSKIKKDTLPYQ